MDKNMKKKDLCLATGMSTTALAKPGKNRHVSTEILGKICKTLYCDFCDIIELVRDDGE
ncbi:MAG: helix-turn-helix domain-containing protein [Christensenellales bacterium]